VIEVDAFLKPLIALVSANLRGRNDCSVLVLKTIRVLAFVLLWLANGSGSLLQVAFSL
jgi:hypothetical protein